MDFGHVVENVITRLDAAKVRYALIGGFAMALRGIQRATIDLDFLLMLEDLERADAIFQQAGYRRAFRSKNVSHYTAKVQSLGRIDILHAFRGPTLSMLDRAERIPLTETASLPVVQVEDLIGLKVQAACNDPLRTTSDWADIRMMTEASGFQSASLDWELINDYLEIFDQTDKLFELKKWYGSAKRSR
jgi:hypothetical protein